MIYTELTKKALKLSFEAHREQTDKSGMPYVYHPFHVAEQMDTEVKTAVALLHDVVEDTDYSLDDIRSLGFPDEVTEALELLTHDDSVPYMEYVGSVSKNPVARAVKLADLRHNSDLSRFDDVDAGAVARVRKYAMAIRILDGEGQKTENIRFCCYSDRYSSLSGRIADGCLSMTSEIYGGDFDSEKHYLFSAEETEKLFSAVTLKEFIELCRTGRVLGMEAFLEGNGITSSGITV
ncbi:MAG: hypothetical protein J5933_06090 [Clostridia bacterium]|nr:hypothetical protein [Clostridia bacterium]